jgi:hypothetical protein
MMKETTACSYATLLYFINILLSECVVKVLYISQKFHNQWESL